MPQEEKTPPVGSDFVFTQLLNPKKNLTQSNWQEWIPSSSLTSGWLNCLFQTINSSELHFSLVYASLVNHFVHIRMFWFWRNWLIDFKDISATALCIGLFYWMAHLCGLVSFTQLDWSAGRKKPQCWLKENKFPEEIKKPLFAWEGGIFHMSDREVWEGHYIFIADLHISSV